MTPKMMEDEDGDCPPCSVMDSYEEARDWDKWKAKKYKGKQKAKPTTDLYHKYYWFYYFCSCFKAAQRE